MRAPDVEERRRVAAGLRSMDAYRNQHAVMASMKRVTGTPTEELRGTRVCTDGALLQRLADLIEPPAAKPSPRYDGGEVVGMECGACWSALPDGARFCPRCGCGVRDE